MKSVPMIKYRLHRYFGSSRPVIPVIFTICFLRFIYSVRPMSIGTGAVLSSIVQFVMMTFITLSLNGGEETVEEQLLLFRGKGWRIYSIARELALIIISIFYAILHILGPIVVNACNDFSFFSTPLTAMDVVKGAFVVLGSGLAGIIIGDVLHPRITGNRRAQLIGTVMLMLLTIVRDALIEKCRVLLFLDILLPPVMKPAHDLGNKECLALKPVLAFFFMMILYYFVVTIVKNLVLQRRRFS